MDNQHGKVTVTYTDESGYSTVVKQQDWICLINCEKTDDGITVDGRANGTISARAAAVAMLHVLHNLTDKPYTWLAGLTVITALALEAQSNTETPDKAGVDIEKLLLDLKDGGHDAQA